MKQLHSAQIYNYQKKEDIYENTFFTLLIIVFCSFTVTAQTTFEKWIGDNYNWDIGFKIIRALDDGYIIAASWTVDYGQSWDTETDAALIKIDENGNIVWRTMIPTVSRYTSSDKLISVIPTNDGGYIATGIIQTEIAVGKEDVLVVKFNQNGDTSWIRKYDFAAYDCGNAIIQSGDGGYIIVGRSGPLGNDNILFFKINANGDTVWSRTWGDAYEDRLNDIVTTGDGNFYAVGCTKQTTYPYALWDYIIKLSTNGDTLWTKKLVGGEAMSIQPLGNGGYILAERGALVEIDANANEVWRKGITTVLGPNGGEFRQVIVLSSGGYVVTGKSDEIDLANPFGTANQQLFLAKLNAEGDTLWVKRFGKNEFNKGDEGYSVVETSDGGYLATGFTCLNESAGVNNIRDIYLVKVNSDGTTAVENSNALHSTAFSLHQNFPNPFNPTTTISFTLHRDSFTTLKIFDFLGREVATLVDAYLDAGTVHTVVFDASHFSSGVYFYKLECNNMLQVKKLIILK